MADIPPWHFFGARFRGLVVGLVGVADCPLTTEIGCTNLTELRTQRASSWEFRETFSATDCNRLQQLKWMIEMIDWRLWHLSHEKLAQNCSENLRKNWTGAGWQRGEGAGKIFRLTQQENLSKLTRFNSMIWQKVEQQIAIFSAAIRREWNTFEIWFKEISKIKY